MVAEKSVQRRKNALAKSDKGLTPRTQLATLGLSTVPHVLSQDYEDYALNFFFPSYILLPGDPQEERSFMTYLYPIWAHVETVSPLKPAVAAVSLCLLEAWSGLQPAQPFSHSRSQYMKAIAALRHDLKSTENVSDHILMTALMLHWYEGIRSFCTSRPNEGPHVTGTAALVEHRRRLPLRSEMSQKMLMAVRKQGVGKALTTKEPLPPSITTWAPTACDIPRTAGYQHDELNIEVVNLQAAAAQVGPEAAVKDSFAVDLLNRTIELDQRLVAWTNTMPEDWTLTRIHDPDLLPKSVRDAGLYQNYYDIYKNLAIANICNAHASSRIKLQIIILACLKHLHPADPGTASVTARKTIQDQADNICGSVPFHLGDRNAISYFGDRRVQYPSVGGVPNLQDHRVEAAAFGGWYLATQLSQLLSPDTPLRDGQRQWIVGQLQRVRRIYVVQPHKAS